KPKAKRVTIQEPDEFRTTSSSQPSQPLQAKDKDAVYELAAKLQEEERGELAVEEKLKLFVKLMNKRKKHFERLRAEERRRKPPTKAQKRKHMCTYLKNMAGFTHNQLKIKDRAVESSKREGEEPVQESAKKQKVDEHVQAKAANDDTAKLKRCLEIVSEDDDVTIKATPLSSISPTIVDYKIYKERKKSYFKIIRADGNSQTI
nr:hypothetical protein [Tanacetum cinerariifolium]